MGKDVNNAVITCPAYVDDSQRQASKDAGLIAGLNVMRTINQPTVAPIRFGPGKRPCGQLDILTFDPDGGPFGVLLLKMMTRLLCYQGDGRRLPPWW